jgi:hypothetical protein
MRRVAQVRLEERDRISHEIRQPARVIQQLANGDALHEGRAVVVEVEQSLGDELQDECRHEDLRHAPDAEAVLGRERLARSHVRQARRGFDPADRALSECDHPRNAGGEDAVELILQRAQRPAAVTTKSVAKPSKIPARRSQLTRTGWPYLRFTANSSRTT